MNNYIKKHFVELLNKTAKDIEAGNCVIDEEQAIEIIKLISHKPMSKEGAAIYLNLSTSRFDALIREGKLPKGRKRLGFKEKVWYQDEISEYKTHLNKNKSVI